MEHWQALLCTLISERRGEVRDFHWVGIGLTGVGGSGVEFGRVALLPAPVKCGPTIFGVGHQSSLPTDATFEGWSHRKMSWPLLRLHCLALPRFLEENEQIIILEG